VVSAVCSALGVAIPGGKVPPSTAAKMAGIWLAVAVVALRQPRRVQRRNRSHGPLGLREAFAPLDAALLVAAYVFTVGPAHASRMEFSVPSRPLNALVDHMLND